MDNRRELIRMLTRTLVRAALSTVLVLAVYFLLPLDAVGDVVAIAIVVVGVLAFIALVAFQVNGIIKAPTPLLRSIEVLAIDLPLFIVTFALAYVVMDSTGGPNFSQSLSRVSSLYFTVTVFSTVGFGDITPITDPARMLVTAQMLLDLLFVGAIVRVLLGASRMGRERRQAEAEGRPPPPPPILS